MVKHGRGRANDKDRAYRTWARIIDRCENKNHNRWERYGGRGISVCERWRRDFSAFLADVGDPPSALHSIDRIDVNGNYEPGNVKWSTATEQARNRRSNRMITIDGVTKCLAEWVTERNLPLPAIEARVYRYGWTYEAALTVPIRKKRKTGCVKKS